MRKKHIEKIKEQIKQERKNKKKDITPDVTFINSLAALCIAKEVHSGTIYKLIKIPHMDQMLDTMYDAIIKEYNLHRPTIEKLRENPSLKKELEEKLKKDYKKEIRIPI